MVMLLQLPILLYTVELQQSKLTAGDSVVWGVTPYTPFVCVAGDFLKFRLVTAWPRLAGYGMDSLYN